MCFIFFVCPAWAEPYHKVQWFFELSRGCKSLMRWGPRYATGRLCLEALVSRKVANREVRTEARLNERIHSFGQVSETAKPGTAEPVFAETAPCRQARSAQTY